jgi:hypothetical protein
MRCENVNRIYPTQNLVQWWGLVNTDNELPGSVKGKEFLE